MEIQNVGIRLCNDPNDDILFAWGECLIVSGENKLYVNNVKIKKKDVGGSLKFVFEYPHKIVKRGEASEKKYYVKPVSKAMYSLIERAFIHRIYEVLKGGTNDKGTEGITGTHKSSST